MHHIASYFGRLADDSTNFFLTVPSLLAPSLAPNRNFIIGPMWDSAVDFCHYRDGKVAKAEALHVLDQVIRSR
jgi:hypothetical protein